MATYTDIDTDNARKFSQYYNGRVRLLQLLHKKYPFVASHLSYTVRKATSEDYTIPESLADKAFVIDIKLTEKVCKKLSCNKYTATGFCQPEIRPHYVYVGDDQYDAVCQPSCFRLNLDPTYNTDGSRAVDFPQLAYNNNRCTIVPDYMSNLLEKSWYRDDSHYINRLNDMPTGFSRVPNKQSKFGCGYTYRNNSTYCKYYDRTLTSDGDCSYRWWEKGLDALVGMSLINTIKSTVRRASGKPKPFDLPENLPPLPDSLLDDDLVYEKWRGDIDATFKMPSLMIFDDPHYQDRIARATHINKQVVSQRVKRSTLVTESNDKHIDAPNPNNSDNSSLPHDHLLEPLEQAKEWLIKAFQHVMEHLCTKEFLETLTINVAYTFAERKIQRLLATLIQDLSKLLTKHMGRVLAAAFPLRCLQASIVTACRSTAIRMVVQLASRSAIAMLKLTSMALSVVGWIMIVAGILDIIFAMWDPYGYNNLYPKDLPHDLMDRGDRALRAEFGEQYCEYTFDLLCSKLLTKDELLQISMESMFDQLIYLNALVMNSDGSLIDKGDPVYSKKPKDDALEISTLSNAQRFRFSATQYRSYNEDYIKRVISNGLLANALHFTAVSSIVSIAIGFYTLALLGLLVCIVLAACTRLSLIEDITKKVFANLGEFGRRMVDNVYEGRPGGTVRSAMRRNNRVVETIINPTTSPTTS